MILDQAVIDRAGRVLIARRTPLEDFHIEGLRKMGGWRHLHPGRGRGS